MGIVLLCGPPCSGKTTLAHHMAQHGDVVLDYDTMAMDLGSPVRWLHPEPYRTQAEHHMQSCMAHAHQARGSGTAWVIRTAPRAEQRRALAAQWRALVYLLNPGEATCRTRAADRPSGTRKSIGEWYHRYSPWSGDLDPVSLDGRWSSVHVDRGVVSLDPELI